LTLEAIMTLTPAYALLDTLSLDHRQFARLLCLPTPILWRVEMKHFQP